MKKIMNKKNRTSRIIALLLVLALIITPMMSYDGKREGAKAAEEGAGDTTGEVAGVSVETAKVPIDFTEGQLTTDVHETDKTYTFSRDYPIKEDRYFYGDKVVGFEVPVTGGKVTLGGNEFEINDSWDVKVVTCAGTAAPQVLEADFNIPTDYTEVGPDTPFTTDSIVYVYARPEVTDWKCTSYTLIAKFTLKKQTPAATCSWEETTSPAQSATLSVTNEYSGYYVGVWKYGFQKAGETDNITWGNEKSISTEGEYTGYVGYFAAKNDAVPLWTSVATTSTMVIDTTPPIVPNSMSDIKLYKGDSEVSEFDATLDPDTQTYYVNGSASDNFKYKLTITDNNGGTGSYSIGNVNDTPMTEFAGDSGTWTTTLEVSATESVQSVIVKDAVGNEAAAVTLPKVEFVNKTFRFTQDPQLKGNPSISDGAYIKDRYEVEFAVESPYQIMSIDVITGDFDEDVQHVEIESSKVEETVYGTWKYSGTADIPLSTEHYKEITKVAVKVTNENPDTNANSITQETTPHYNYKFDDEAPVIQSMEIREDATNTPNYTEISDDAISANSSYSIVKGDSTSYRYYVTAKDGGVDGVGIATVEGSFDQNMSDAKKFTQDATSGEYYLEIKDDWLPEDGTGKTLYVKVADKAGNVSNTDAYGISIKAAYTDLQIDKQGTLLTKGNGDPVPLTEIDEITNAETNYKLNLQASSGYPITSLYIKQGSKIYKEIPEAGGAALENTYDPVTKRYTAEYEFTINPSDLSTDNVQLDDWVACAADSDATHSDVSENIGRILYDNTKPIVKKIDGTNPDTSSETDLVTEPGWYNAFSFSAKITSGPQAVESSITSASYTISNAVTEYDGVDLTNSIAPDGTVTVNNITVPESAVPTGTVITFAATDKAGNTIQEPYIETVRVDNTAPTVDSLKVNGSYVNEKPLSGFPTVTTTVSDKLALNNITINVKGPNNNVQTQSVNYGDNDALAANGSVSKDVSFTLAPPSGMTSLLDGSYYVEVIATDKAGNPAKILKTTFKIDNTIPVVTAKIASGTMGGKKLAKNFDGTDCDYYYRSDVGVQLTYDDDNIDSVVVTDNGKVVNVTWTPTGVGNKQVANMAVSATGRHTIKINATDKTGNKALEKQVVFVRDVAGPTITAVINGGQIYTENMGTVDITRDTTLSFSVSDANEDVNDFNYRLTKKLPDQPAVTGAYIKTTNRAMTYAEEADYTVEVYSVDMASNIGPTRNISFRVDKTAPDISISGGGNGGTSNGGVTLSFNMKEAFWWDASGNVTIYRKAGDGSTESQYKTIDYKPTAFSTAVSESLTETGTYRIEFTARDRAGHTANTTQTFTIDREAPVITLSGVDNYDKTDKDVTFMAKVADDFYTTKKVVLSGTREDASGTKNQLEFSSFNEAGNPTVINELFQKSGIYDIQVTSEDVAGNKDTQTVHFTIDKDKPEIAELPIEEGAVLNVFESVIDTDELVSDLTVCDVHMYLNGVEYDGDSQLEDGSYTLLITAEDELGNYSEKSVNFELDTKAPVFIVTGVEDGEVKNEAYSITVSLQIAEDTLASVELNGNAVELTDNTATIEVTEKGKYTLTMSAVDKAQNFAGQTITFRYGEKNNIWIWILIGAGALLIIGGIIILIVKKRKK